MVGGCSGYPTRNRGGKADPTGAGGVAAVPEGTRGGEDAAGEALRRSLAGLGGEGGEAGLPGGESPPGHRARGGGGGLDPRSRARRFRPPRRLLSWSPGGLDG